MAAHVLMAGSERDIFRYVERLALKWGFVPGWGQKKKGKSKKQGEWEWEYGLAFTVVAITLHGVIFNDNSATIQSFQQKPQPGHDSVYIQVSVCVSVCVRECVYFCLFQ